MIFPRLLLCTDLDRTLMPNGPEPESKNARFLFKKLCERAEFTLVYVSGRDKNLMLAAINEFELPIPDYAITDVGSVIYKTDGIKWHRCKEWTQKIAQDWKGKSASDLYPLLHIVQELQLQESEKQNTFKLSYYLPIQESPYEIIKKLEHILKSNNIKSNIIWSIDTVNKTGLIDILPPSANKLTAIKWLAKLLNIKSTNIIFAGDSGNDIDVISSDVASIIVANATSDFKNLALSITHERHTEESLYIATGLIQGMNGNYAAGILEGICHYFPELTEWLSSVSTNDSS